MKPNDYLILEDGTGLIVIDSPKYGTQYAQIDHADYPLVEQYHWTLFVPKGRGTRYALGWLNGYGGRLHRLIMSKPPGQVDHRDGDGLNNTRANLRLASASQNQWNKGRYRNNTSGYIGVSWSRSRSRWEAYVSKGGRRHAVGFYDDPVAAAKARDETAVSLHGPFARLNFPEGP